MQIKLTTSSIYTIDYQALKSGVTEITFNIENDLFTLWDESEISGGSGNINVLINKNGNVAQMDTKIDAIVSVICDRCLDPVDVKVEWEGKCVIKVSDEQGEYDGDILWVGTRENMVDFGQYFYESIVLGLPICRSHESVEQCNQEVVKFISGVESVEQVDDHQNEEIEKE